MFDSICDHLRVCVYVNKDHGVWVKAWKRRFLRRLFCKEVTQKTSAAGLKNKLSVQERAT